MKIKMGRSCSQNEKWSPLKMFTGKPTGKRPLGRPRGRQENNIRMNLKINRYHYEELSLFGSGEGLMESPCECRIKPRTSISYGVI
jgi:hypothetical protein